MQTAPTPTHPTSSQPGAASGPRSRADSSEFWRPPRPHRSPGCGCLLLAGLAGLAAVVAKAIAGRS
jgi:hypothetical protein